MFINWGDKIMGKCKAFIFGLLFFICSLNCYAGQIAIQVVQHDNVFEDVSESSLTVEDELLTGFYDIGYIVTNSPAVTSTSKGTDEKCFSVGMNEAYNGCADFFVQIKLFYTGEKSELKKVDWSLYSVNTGKKIEANTIKDFVLDENNETDLHIVSLQLISKIKEAINE